MNLKEDLTQKQFDTVFYQYVQQVSSHYLVPERFKRYLLRKMIQSRRA